VSDTPQGQGWWQASDGKWYPPESAPGPTVPQAPPPAGPPVSPPGPAAPTGPAAYEPPTPGGSAPAQKTATVGEAFNYGWLKFQQNIGEIIIVAIVAFVAIAAVVVIGWLILAGTLWASSDSINCTTNQTTGEVSCSGGDSAGFAAFWIGGAILWVIWMFMIFMVQMMFIRAALLITYGEKLEVRKMFSTDGIGPYIVASIIVAIGVLIGSWLCVIPGLIIWFFTFFYGFFILDKKMGALDSIKSSFQLVNKNLGSLIGFVIAAWIANFIGALLCGIGLIVSIPVVVIATGFMYRRLQGEPVAA
jgi:uncharacterized membrane protein